MGGRPGRLHPDPAPSTAKKLLAPVGVGRRDERNKLLNALRHEDMPAQVGGHDKGLLHNIMARVFAKVYDNDVVGRGCINNGKERLDAEKR